VSDPAALSPGPQELAGSLLYLLSPDILDRPIYTARLLSLRIEPLDRYSGNCIRRFFKTEACSRKSFDWISLAIADCAFLSWRTSDKLTN